MCNVQQDLTVLDGLSSYVLTHITAGDSANGGWSCRFVAESGASLQTR